jgi:hypothetical protein
MCPVCLATAAIIAGSATGTGGLTALVARKFRARKDDARLPINAAPKEDYDGHEPDTNSSSQVCLPRGVD